MIGSVGEGEGGREDRGVAEDEHSGARVSEQLGCGSAPQGGPVGDSVEGSRAASRDDGSGDGSSHSWEASESDAGDDGDSFPAVHVSGFVGGGLSAEAASVL